MPIARCVPSTAAIANAPIGAPPVMSSSSSLNVAHARGWVEEEFRRDGIAVEWVFFKGTGPAVNEALTTDALDLALQGDLPALIGRASGLRTRVLLSTSNRTKIYVAVPNDSSIRTVADYCGCGRGAACRSKSGEKSSKASRCRCGCRLRSIRS